MDFRLSGARPGEYRGEGVKEIFDKEYPFYEKLYRLGMREQIKLLFDNPDKVNEILRRKYDGRIAGVSARIYFSKVCSCRVHVKEQDNLKKVYDKVRERLSSSLER